MGCKIFKIKSNNDQKQQDNIPIQKTKVLVNTYGTQNCQNKVKKQDVFSQVQNCLKLKYQDPAILYVIERIPHGMSSYGQVSKGYNRITLEQRLFKKISVKNIELEEQQKFIKEIIRLSQLDHANIPKICDFYYYEDYFILVTASLDGEELFDFIVNNGQCHETLAAIIVKQILTTIIYCHQQNIIHKDLKPENIYIDKQNDESLSIKVIDFGTSLHFNRKREDMGNFGTPYYLAPEVFKRNSSFKRDIWSLGVILYILLCGYPPFNGINEQEIKNNVLLGVFNFDGKEWDSISDEAKDYVTKLLLYDQNQRLSAVEAIEHEWIKKFSKQNITNQYQVTNALTNLNKFRSYQLLQKITYMFLANYFLLKTEKQELLKIFQTLDLNNDGQLSREELIFGYKETLKIENAEQEVDKILAKVDRNDNGSIDFTEFVLVTCNKQKLLSIDNLEKTFRLIDEDNSGTVNKQEIKSFFFGTHLPDNILDFMISEIDIDHDGEVISMDEFKCMMVAILEKEIPYQAN